MKVVVNYDTCASLGACAQNAPEVFEVRSDGYMYVIQEHPDEELRAKVVAAVENCPTASLSIED